MEKTVPFTKEQAEEMIAEFGSPFHIYDEKSMRANAKQFMKSFRQLNGFQQFFAVKALPNPYILKILKEEGMGVDCSSLPELLLAEKAGFCGEKIMFSSNDTPMAEFVKAKELGAYINLDDVSHIEFLEQSAGLPDTVCFRYNPGSDRSGNTIIGDPKEAKYGLTKKQLFEGYETLKRKGVKRFGLHTMVISNELNQDYFVETAKVMFELVVQIKEKLGIEIDFVNLGGGIGIPYKPEESPVSYGEIAEGVQQNYDELIKANGLSVRVFMECGRVITGSYGYLVATVRHLKHTYKDYVGLDATMANLMRPGMYGAYHHITVLGKEDSEEDHVYDVTGSLCENNDKFAIDRKLPEVERGDLVVVHDTGAHGHAMGFNYNGKLRSAELLLREDGSVVQIRRAETTDDYFATLDFSGLEEF